MEFFKQHQTMILRIAGGSILFIALVVHFWLNPKQGVSENEKAAANVARMEAKVQGVGVAKQQKKPDISPFAQALKAKQKQHIQYMFILAMIVGGGVFLYSFIAKKEE